MDLDKVDPSDVEIMPWLRLGRFAPFQWERTIHDTTIRLFWNRIVVWLFVLALVGWVALSAAIFAFVKYRRGFTTVQYTHLLFFPWQKADYRKTKCEFLLAKGKVQFVDKQYLESFYNMRLGLLELPQDIEARQNVARLYHSVKRPDLAEIMLLEGVPYNIKNFDYVISVFQYMFSRQRDESVIREARDFLKITELKPDVRNALVLAQASAAFFRGQNNRAERIVIQHKLTADRIGGLLRAQIAWESGRKDEAIAQLAEHAQRYPTANEIYNQQLSYLRDLGRIRDIRSLCVLRQIEHPTLPRGYVDELTTLDPETDAVRWTTTLEAIFTRFPSSLDAMNGLAEVAVRMGRPELATQAYEQCRRSGLAWQQSAMAIVESNLAAKRYPAALDAALSILRENEIWASEHGTELNALRAVANYALADTVLAELQLRNYLESVPPDTHNLVAVAERFIQVGAVSLASTVLEKALARDEFNQPALTRRIELEVVATEAGMAYAESLLTMRKPSQSALNHVKTLVQSDRSLLLPGRDRFLDRLTHHLRATRAQGTDE